MYADSSSLELQPALRVYSAAFQQYSLPLNLPVTTGAGLQYRQGCLLRLHTDAAAGCSQGIVGVGEVAPLPGKSWMIARHELAHCKGAVSGPDLGCLLFICRDANSAWQVPKASLSAAPLYPAALQQKLSPVL